MLQRIGSVLKESQSKFSNPYHFKEAAVFIPLVELENKLHLLFEVRSLHLNHQPGDICFPGGKVDTKDSSPQITALREVTEELGVQLEQIKLLGALDYFVSPLGYVIYPFCGQILDLSAIQSNSEEVSNFFTVPLEWFINNKPQIHQVNLGSQFNDSVNIPLDNLSPNWHIHSKINVLFYCYQHHVIWGLTAEIIQQFLYKIEPSLQEI